MDNYQEWVDPPTVVGDTDRTDPIIKHIKPDNQKNDQHTSNLKLNISSGSQLLYSMLYKVIYFMLICAFKNIITTCKTIICVIDKLFGVAISAPITLYN